MWLLSQRICFWWDLFPSLLTAQFTLHDVSILPKWAILFCDYKLLHLNAAVRYVSECHLLVFCKSVAHVAEQLLVALISEMKSICNDDFFNKIKSTFLSSWSLDCFICTNWPGKPHSLLILLGSKLYFQPFSP